MGPYLGTCKVALITLVTLLCTAPYAQAQGEDAFNDSLCRTLQGEREVRHYYNYGDGQQSFVIVDCETDCHAIEGGLDKRSSLDSLQQALFFGELTGKTPAVVIYDTNGKVGRYEHRIQTASEKAGVQFLLLRSDDTRDPVILAPVLCPETSASRGQIRRR